jgi:hypothetical protein
LAAVSNAIRSHDTLSPFSRVRDRYRAHRDIVVAIVGTTDKPAAWRKDTKTSRADTAWKLGTRGREEISSDAALVRECGFMWIISKSPELMSVVH